MPATLTETPSQYLEILRDITINAPIDIVFETLLEQVGPRNETPDGAKLNMVLEPWPGGRWFRDLGNNAGHLWGHVQSIVPSSLLELHGPMFISAPAICHVLYRLKEENGQTHIAFSHKIHGIIPTQFLDGVAINKGWDKLFDNLQKRVTNRTKAI